MPDMSNPHEVLEHLAEMCEFHAEKARHTAALAQIRAETWDEAARDARQHLADFEKWNPRTGHTTEETQ